MAMSYRGVRALITGHTGFKGSWLTAWLKQDGAEVFGLSLAPESGRLNLFEAAKIADGIDSTIGDIRDANIVHKLMERVRPQIVFHLAAQPLVRRSYAQPVETFATNVMGTVHVLEAARTCKSVKAVVCITTDKVYDNHEWVWGYREQDGLGGKDPYSASKACAELVAASYMKTMMPLAGDLRLATARGGNVIGGGDWSEDRLVPDVVRAIGKKQNIVLRNPSSIRPWQHVLDLIHAYLILGERLLGSGEGVGAWNFGPERQNEVPVVDLVASLLEAWGDRTVQMDVQPSALVEAHFLRLDIAKAANLLHWTPHLGLKETIAWTANWYRRFQEGQDASALIAEQIGLYREQVKTDLKLSFSSPRN
jgi:CDP-glucose 4,6-dehydratase